MRTERTLALRCSACGRLHCQTFSLFAFSKDRVHSAECTCGSRIALLTHRGRIYCITFACVVCEISHQQELLHLWRRELISLRCPGTGIGAGCVGTEERVIEAVAGGGSACSPCGSAAALNAESEEDSYVASRLQEIAASGRREAAD